MDLLQQVLNFYLIYWICIIARISQTFPEPPLKSFCLSHQTCGECISAHHECEWCTKQKFQDNRCNLRENLLKAGCPEENITNEKGIFTITENEVMGVKSNKSGKLIQLAPQRIELKIRPKQPYTFSVNFFQSEDYPIDLYYLMDLSHSMADDKDMLAKLGNELARSMTKMTNKFRLGFGSFVDKVALPFTFTYPPFLENPCSGNDQVCHPAYSFKHHLSLDANVSKFSEEVRLAPTSGNIDLLEGGFDALIQTMECEKEIGWRMNSRKIILFSTDAPFHLAGDGKLAGIVKPNDGLCHLKNNYYIMAEKQDYPSIGQVNEKAKKKKVNIIFAVDASSISAYKEIVELIEGSTSAIIEPDSSNIVQLIREQYEQISSEVELKHTASNDVKISYSSKCLGNMFKETNVCKGLKIGSGVSFNVTVQIESCKPVKNFKIYPVGLNDELSLSIEPICHCSCEEEAFKQPDSPYCSLGHGTYECGICNCNPGRFGHLCECDHSMHYLSDSNPCSQNNSTDVCSNRGQCFCGMCKCHERETPGERIYGPYCECDNFSCLRYNNLLCGGPKHGSCECGECLCSDEWTGEACDCPSNHHDCINPDSQKVCSNQGECVCGECSCNISNPKRLFSGKFCNICMGCECDYINQDECDKVCEKLKPCLTCEESDNGDECEDVCQLFDIQDAEEWDYNTTAVATQCHVKSDVDPECVYTLVLNQTLSTENKKVFVRRKVCEKSIVSVLAIGLGVSLTVLVVGLILLLIWKILTYWYDKREFERFEKERKCAKFDKGENPIYRKAVSSFRNPVYTASQTSLADI